jgi:hypothetical protein
MTRKQHWDLEDRLDQEQDPRKRAILQLRLLCYGLLRRQFMDITNMTTEIVDDIIKAARKED